jgi:hypothetical protein
VGNGCIDADTAGSPQSDTVQLTASLVLHQRAKEKTQPEPSTAARSQTYRLDRDGEGFSGFCRLYQLLNLIDRPDLVSLITPPLRSSSG